MGIGTCFLWVFPIAFLMFKSIDKSVGLRVSAEEEMKGLVLAEHGGNERGFKKPSRGQTHPIDKFLLL